MVGDWGTIMFDVIYILNITFHLPVFTSSLLTMSLLVTSRPGCSKLTMSSDNVSLGLKKHQVQLVVLEKAQF